MNQVSIKKTDVLDFKCINLKCRKKHRCLRFTTEKSIKKQISYKPIPVGHGQTFCIKFIDNVPLSEDRKT